MTVPLEGGLQNSFGAPPAAWFVRMWRTFGTQALALADQAVVSGASFLTTVLIGRWSDASELGVYALATSILASSLAMQESLVSLPYAIQRHRPDGTASERAGNALKHGILLSTAAAAVLMVIALATGFREQGSQQASVLWALAAVLPFALLREFGRGFAFARLRMGEALALDTAVAAIQLSALGLLGWSGSVSAVSALMAVGGACCAGGLLWGVLARRNFTFRPGTTRSSIAESLSLGKWLFAGRLAFQVQWYITYWLSVVILGAAATGVYAACMSVVAISNPLVSGLNNILTPRAVLAWKNEGAAGLRRQAIWDALFIGAMMGAFCLLIFFAGGAMMHLLFKGPDYEGQGHTVSVLALALLVQAVGTPASSALASMERPRAIVAVSVIATIVTVLLVWFLMVEAGLLGAAYGFLAGNIAGTAGRWSAFIAIAPAAAPDQTPALRVLEQLSQQPLAGWCEISPLGEGTHATVSSIKSKLPQPIWHGHDCLIVKLYKAEANIAMSEAQAQFDILAKLHASLNGRVVDGWKIYVPEPLWICSSPMALVMTVVPGRDLYAWTATENGAGLAGLDEAAKVSVSAITQSWHDNIMHGDLALQNILFDFDTKSLAFIDGGTSTCCVTCHDFRHQWTSATRDLAHILSDVLTDVKKTIGNRPARVRRNYFAESVLKAYLAQGGSDRPPAQQLADIRLCMLAHLEDLFQLSWSAHGLWCWFLKVTAKRRLDAMLARLYADADAISSAART